MNILYYDDINYSRVKKQFQKTVAFLENNDFASAEIKKVTNTDYYRAKLDYENRLLFKFARYNGQSYLLLLEVIYNHEYEKSRFLRGAKIDENKLAILKNEKSVPEQEITELNYLNTGNNKFHLLNKVISFDEIQENLFTIKPPVVIIGSAGSGKTVLTLEKIKSLKGNVLYVTLSPFLVENSSKLYYSDNYINEKQEVDFLSFKEFLDTQKIIPGRELDYKSFNTWLQPRQQAFGIKDSYKLFEEFRGVITGMDITKEFLRKEDYLDLGIKQSIFLANEREKVYVAFTKYMEFLNENHFCDLNVIAYQWLKYIRPQYDFIVIDEVQDFTNIQLYVVLKSLKINGNFILCGDSNQVVHPNFFSWTNVKTMFYKNDITGSDIKVLRTNYRNSTDITGVANKLLKLKNARFGSIDKESTYLVKPLAENKGKVSFYCDSHKIKKQLNDSTARSTKYAVLVMNQDDKAEARKIFKTPLLFSIHEAKGLEYDNIILLDFISKNAREFHQITQGITAKDMEGDDLNFSRGKDKADKSLDVYKFYINSLYVGITRAIKNLFIIESSKKHDILTLLDFIETGENVTIKTEVSSLDDWKEEARKLELQGKKEQADEITQTILSFQKPDWEPITHESVVELKKQALDPDNFNKKAKDLLFAYALLYNDIKSIKMLAEMKYRRAEQPENERNSVYRKYYADYNSDNIKAVERNIQKYGINYRDQFNLTPLLAAIGSGSIKVLSFLIQNNADMEATDHFGRNPLRIALHQAFFSKAGKSKLNDLYPRLLTDNIRIKVDDRLVKIANYKMEYFLLNMFMALQDAITEHRRERYYLFGIRAGDIEELVADYPASVIPEFRKKRTYISSVLAKNEKDSSSPYNNALFIRVEHGYYCLNPELSVMSYDQWKDVYSFAQLKDVKFASLRDKNERFINKFVDELSQTRKNNLAVDAHFNKLLASKNISVKDEKLGWLREMNKPLNEEKERKRMEAIERLKIAKLEREQEAIEKEQKRKEFNIKKKKADDDQYELPF